MATGFGPKSPIVTSQDFYFDPGNPRCYSGAGTTMSDLWTSGRTETITGATFSSADNNGKGAWLYNADGEKGDIGSLEVWQGDDTCFAWVKYNSLAVDSWLIGQNTNVGHGLIVRPSVGTYGSIGIRNQSNIYYYVALTAANQLEAGVWYLLTWTISTANDMYIGIDDSFYGPTNVSTSYVYVEHFGDAYQPGTSFVPNCYLGIHGYINNQITGTELKQIYDATRARYGK